MSTTINNTHNNISEYKLSEKTIKEFVIWLATHKLRDVAFDDAYCHALGVASAFSKDPEEYCDVLRKNRDSIQMMLLKIEVTASNIVTYNAAKVIVCALCAVDAHGDKLLEYAQLAADAAILTDTPENNDLAMAYQVDWLNRYCCC